MADMKLGKVVGGGVSGVPGPSAQKAVEAAKVLGLKLEENRQTVRPKDANELALSLSVLLPDALKGRLGSDPSFQQPVVRRELEQDRYSDIPMENPAVLRIRQHQIGDADLNLKPGFRKAGGITQRVELDLTGVIRSRHETEGKPLQFRLAKFAEGQDPFKFETEVEHLQVNGKLRDQLDKIQQLQMQAIRHIR
jgi:hypothetical protein